MGLLKSAIIFIVLILAPFSFAEDLEEMLDDSTSVFSCTVPPLNVEIFKYKEVQDSSFEGEGCAISLASASILTEIIKGKDYNVAKKIIEDFLNMIKNETKITINSLSDEQKTTLMSLSGVKQFPMRVKCATMAWHTFNTALEGKK